MSTEIVEKKKQAYVNQKIQLRAPLIHFNTDLHV